MTVNPFTLKELRQLTRSKAVSGLLMTYLAACCGIAYLVPLSGIDQTTGESVFAVLSFVLSLSVALVLPVFVFFRLIRERGGRRNADFTLMTSLPPADVVDGKLRAAFAVIAVFASATMPFGAFCYLLHGITLVDMLTTLAVTVCVACVMLHLLLCCGMMRVSRAFGIVLVVVLMLVFMAVSAVSLDGGFERGEGSGLAYWVTLSATACLFLRALSIALFTPAVMERDRRLRLTTLVLSGAWLAWTAFSCHGRPDSALSDGLGAWTRLSVAAALVLAMFASVQPVGYSRRMMCSRPGSRWARLLVWPLSSGAANGFFFALVFGAAAALVFPFAFNLLRDASSGADPEGAVKAMESRFAPLAFLLYVMSALMALRAVWRWLRRFWRIPVGLVPVLALGTLGFLQTVGPLMSLQGVTGFDEVRMPFSLSGMLDQPILHLFYSSIAFCAAALLNAVAFFKALWQYVSGGPAEAAR